ncbi:pre-mRNA-splicing factor SYF1 [Ochromonadaceae sp. CCMP2298]|nr:pre-mRNA-splicing factor SYF1 [Ochromonadaceae sp. CCMP2298]|mmetsp:Transcript_23588/g.53370  ORF Transcript_23588/g.53370 Transcript_23588/m.53370 type:complete len:843 (+) Transcript_23588:171-2699(+)
MDAQDVQFEEEIARNPHYVKVWWSYLVVKHDAAPSARYMIYERALKYLPRSYKLWHAYLLERKRRADNKSVTSKKVQILVNTYERALVSMHKMPRIWLDYLELLVSLHKGTDARLAFDRCLQALPITQHKEVWKVYIDWATGFGVAETAVRVYRRYLMYDPAYREEFVTYLQGIGQFEEAARQLSLCLDDTHFVSPSGQTEHQMWMKLCDICARHPAAVVNTLNVEAIIRSGITKFSDEVGRLWTSLADYYIRLGQFEKARDVYEEAINSVTTVRDFTIVFDAYVKVEESVLSTKIRFMEAEGETDEEDPDEMADVNMRLARIEYLMDKRPLLLNSVVLRQNPHNVHEWHKRAKLYAEDQARATMTYVEAVKTVDPKLANGKLSGLWLAFARFYEQHGDAENARTILRKATEVPYKTLDELANVWCAWGEMEMRLETYENALRVMQQSVTEPTQSSTRRRAQAAAQGQGRDDYAEHYQGSTVADRLHKNTKVWSLYLDLEESLGSVESCRAAYERVMDLKVVTAQMALNYAAFLEEHEFFEDSFRVYERAVALFVFPQVKQVWLLYLDKFLARYGGSKLERLRDLFEQSVAKVPPEAAAEFYIKYANAEEQYGLARHAMAVFDRATRAVPDAARLDMYRLYIKKAEGLFGVTKTRPIYERALGDLQDDDARELCGEFAEVERKLGEVDRARAVMVFGSQFADPRRHRGYWSKWREFEESHGNEDTFRDMLRVQRSVETAFSHVNYTALDMLRSQAQLDAEKAGGAAAPAAAGGKGASVMGMVAASSSAVPRIASSMDALAADAEQEALDAAGQSAKRKFMGGDDDEDGPARKEPKDADEIDI